MPTSSYTYARNGGSGWTQTIYSALMRRMAIHFAFAAQETGGGGGHRTRFIRLWRPTFYQSELHPHFQRAIKNPALGRVRCKCKYTQTLNTRLPK
jgi:hypothetical protein